MAVNGVTYILTNEVRVTARSEDGRKLNQLTDNVKKTGKGAKDAGKQFDLFGMSIGKLAQKALVTIPLWYALRTAFLGIITVVQNIKKEYTDLNEIVAKGIAVSGASNNTRAFRQELEALFQVLSLQTGKDIKDIGEAYYLLATAGIEAQSAIAGTKVALATSLGTWGDSAETARALADIYNVLGSSITGVKNDTEKFIVIGGVIADLWTDNNFKLNEFTDSVKTSGAVLSAAGLSWKESAALIATLNNQMVRGTRAGSNLSRTILFVIKNLDRVETLLRKDIDIKNVNMFELITEIITALDNLGSKAEKIFSASEIAGIRGALSFSTLADATEKLNENINKINSKNVNDLKSVLDGLVEIRLNTVSAQLDRMGKSLSVGGTLFLQAAFGGQDFAVTLKFINDGIQKQLIPTLIILGSVLSPIIKSLGLLAVGAKGGAGIVLGKGASKEELEAFVALSKSIAGDFGIGGKGLIDKTIKDIDNYNKLLKQGLLTTDTEKEIREKFEKLFDEVGTETIDGGRKAAQGFRDGFQDELKKVFKGEGQDFFANIGELFSDQIAESAAKGLTEAVSKTGAFDAIGDLFFGVEDMFASPGELIEKKMISGGEKSGDIIANKMIDAAIIINNKKSGYAFDPFNPNAPTGLPGTYNRSQSISNALGIQSQLGFPTSSSKPGFFGSLFGSLKSGGSNLLAASGGLTTLLGMGGASYAISKGAGKSGIGLLGGSLSGMGAMGGLSAMISAFKGVGQVGPTVGGMAGMGQMGALGGIAPILGILGGGLQAFSGFKSGNVVGGIGGTLTALGGALSMTGAGAVVGVPLMIAGAITSMFGGGKKKTTQVTTQEETFKVSSKIDITNKRLEMIGRDLSAIKQAVTTYILPESAYFSEGNIADRFNIDSKRLY